VLQGGRSLIDVPKDEIESLDAVDALRQPLDQIGGQAVPDGEAFGQQASQGLDPRNLVLPLSGRVQAAAGRQ
jgi:hypothetical protein